METKGRREGEMGGWGTDKGTEREREGRRGEEGRKGRWDRGRDVGRRGEVLRNLSTWNPALVTVR